MGLFKLTLLSYRGRKRLGYGKVIRIEALQKNTRRSNWLRRVNAGVLCVFPLIGARPRTRYDYSPETVIWLSTDFTPLTLRTTRSTRVLSAAFWTEPINVTFPFMTVAVTPSADSLGSSLNFLSTAA